MQDWQTDRQVDSLLVCLIVNTVVDIVHKCIKVVMSKCAHGMLLVGWHTSTSFCMTSAERFDRARSNSWATMEVNAPLCLCWAHSSPTDCMDSICLGFRSTYGLALVRMRLESSSLITTRSVNNWVTWCDIYYNVLLANRHRGRQTGLPPSGNHDWACAAVAHIRWTICTCSHGL